MRNALGDIARVDRAGVAVVYCHGGVVNTRHSIAAIGSTSVVVVQVDGGVVDTSYWIAAVSRAHVAVILNEGNTRLTRAATAHLRTVAYGRVVAAQAVRGVLYADDLATIRRANVGVINWCLCTTISGRGAHVCTPA